MNMVHVVVVHVVPEDSGNIMFEQLLRSNGSIIQEYPKEQYTITGEK